MKEEVEPERQTRVREAGVLALSLIALFAFFWPVVRDSYPVLDCGNVTGSLSHLRQLHPDLGDRIRAVVLGDAGRGHYKPVQDVLYQISYERFGPEGWTRPIAAIQILFHLLAALMLHVVVRRMGGSAAVGYFCAIVYALHPVVDESLVCVHFGNQFIPTFFALAACASIWPVRPLSWWRHPLAGVLVFLAGCSNPNWIMTAPLLVGSLAFVGALRPFSWRAFLVPLVIVAVATAGTAALRYQVNGTLGSKQAGYVDRGVPRDARDAAERAVRCGRSIVRSAVLLWPSKTTQDGDLGLWDEPPEETLVRPEIADRRTVAWILFAAMLTALGASLHGRRTDAASAIRLLAFAAFGGLALVLPYYLLVENIDRNRYVFPLPAFGAVPVVLLLEAAAALLTGTRRGRAALLAFLAAPVIVVFVQIDAASIASISKGTRTARSAADQLYSAVTGDPALRRVYVLGFPRRFGRSGYTWVHPGHLRGLTAARQRSAGMEPIRGGDHYLTADVASGELATSPLPRDAAVFRWDDGRLVRLPSAPDLAPSGPLGPLLHDEIMERWWIGGRKLDLFETSSALEALRIARTIPVRNPRQIGKLEFALDRMDAPVPAADFDVAEFTGFATPAAYGETLEVLAARGVLRGSILLRAAENARGSRRLAAAVRAATTGFPQAMKERVLAILTRPTTPVNAAEPPDGVELTAALPADQSVLRTGETTVVFGIVNRGATPCPPLAVECTWTRGGEVVARRSFAIAGGLAAMTARRVPAYLEAPATAGVFTLTVAFAGGAPSARFEIDVLD